VGRLRDELRSLFTDATVNRMMKDNGWLFGSNALSLLMGFTTGVLVARTLGLVQFGTVAIVVSFVAIVNALTSFRMREFVVRYIGAAVGRGETREAAATAKAALGAEALMSCIAFAAAVILAPWATRAFLPDGAGSGLIETYAFVILANLVSESTKGVLQVFGDFRMMAAAGVGEQVIRLGGVVILALSGGGPRSVLIVYVVAQAAGCCAMALIAVRHLGRQLDKAWWRAPVAVLRPRARSLIGFALNTNLGSTLSLVSKRIDMLFLGAFAGPAEAGYFGLAQSLVGISFLPVASLTDPFYPVISREVDRGHAREARRLIGSGTKVTLFWVIPSGVLALATVWFLIPLVYGSSFSPTALAFVLMWPGTAFAQALFWARPTLLALGRPGYGNIVSASLCVVKIGLLFLLIPPFGYVASAAILSAFGFSSAGLMARKALRLLGDEAEHDVPDIRAEGPSGLVQAPPRASTAGLP
jgi:O-antigen/teichoic acid export membrane protein